MKKLCDSLYCNTHFIAVVWNQIHISKGLSVFYILQKNTQTSEKVSNIKARAQNKQRKAYWDHLPQIGTWTQPNACMGFESMWLGLNPAKTHGAWIQDTMKFMFLMSHLRKNLLRDKVIGKKWFIQIRRGTYLQTKCGPSQRVSAAMKCVTVSFYGLGNFIS